MFQPVLASIFLSPVFFVFRSFPHHSHGLIHVDPLLEKEKPRLSRFDGFSMFNFPFFLAFSVSQSFPCKSLRCRLR